MGKSKAPPPPDYAAAAVKQGEANVEATRLANRLNNPNVNSPLGSRRIVFGSPQSIDDVTINETLSPEGQRLFDQENRLSAAYGDIGERGLDRLAMSFGSAFDQSGLPQVSGVNNSAFGQFNPGQVSQYQQPQGIPAINSRAVNQSGLQNVGINQIGADTMSRDRVEQALFDRLQPRLDETRRQREEALIMQGQGRGGAAWNTQQRDLSQSETDAQIGAILGAGQEQQRLYNMAQSDSNRLYGQQMGLRSQQFGEQQSEYGRGFQENLAERQQMQGENLADYQAQLQGQNAQFNRALAANQQNQAGQQALYGIQSQNRSRALQEALVLRQLPLQEINALRTGAQPTLPQFQSFQGQQIQAAPVFDAVNQQYQANLGQVNAKNAQKAATFKAIAGLGGEAFRGAGAAGGFGALFG